MALLIQNAKFKNTEVLAPTMYVRLQYLAQADGKKASVALIQALDKASALSWQTISTNIPESNLVTLSEGESQDLLTIHQKVKENLENLNLGFIITIDLA